MKQIKAIEVFGMPYMTQSAEVELEQRLFVTAISSKSITIADWRGATAEEKAEWQVEMENNTNKKGGVNYGKDCRLFD